MMQRCVPLGGVVRRGLAVAALCAGPMVGSSSAAGGPNVIILNIDDMGLNDLSPYNVDSVQADTPTAARLASEGLKVNNFYSASPICSPSRAGLLTGQYPSRWGINSFIDSRADNLARDTRDFISLQAPMIQRTLQQAGYATANVGKWHLGGGRDVGYNIAPVVTAYGFDSSITQFEGLGDRVLYQTRDGTALEGLSQASKNLGTRNGQDTLYEIQRDESSAFYVDRAISFIQQTRQSNPDKPFFINLAFDDAHTPYDPKPALLQKYQQRYPSLPAAVQQYLAVVENLDTQIGRLVDSIDSAGLGNNTLILLTADNGASGPTANQGGSVGSLRGQKGSLYEGGIREPLIARWTGRIDPGQVNNTTVMSAVDVFPTLASIGGLLPAASAGTDGQDMSAALLDGVQTVRSGRLFWDYGRNSHHVGPAPGNYDHSPNLALREGKYKFLIDGDGTKAALYDLSVDPNETNNIAAQNDDRVHSMARQALALRYEMPSIIAPQSSTQLVQLRADNLAGVDGSAVSAFADSTTGDSFNGSLAQSNSSNRPTLRTAALNGHNVLQFDGNDYLTSSQTNSLTNANNGMTVFLVATGDQSGQIAQRAAQIGSSTGEAGRVAGFDLSSETGVRFNNGASTYDAGLDPSQFHIFVFQIDQGMSYDQATMFIDGTMAENTFTGSSTNTSSLVNFSGSDLELILGNGRNSSGGILPGDYFTGSVAEMLLYNEQMSELQINLVANYLSSQYGLPFAYDTTTAVPEPSAALPLALGAIGLRRRRR